MPLIRFPGGWRLAEKTVRYTRDGEEHEQVMGDEGEQWWHDFAVKWPETQIIEFTQLHYSPEQLARLDEVQGVGGEHADAVRSYVLDGVVPDGGIDWPPGKGLAMQDVINAELLLGQAQLIESNAAIEETAALILLETVGGGL